MKDSQPPLHPWTLNQLLGRVEQEWSQRREIFGLPGRRFFKPEPGIDLAGEVGGQRLATPVGPAAGPHTQLAQNIVLGWLAGARSFELKTVQVLDELEIDRPCIDMESLGYNVEWSQELSLEQSLNEYAKAGLMLAILRRWPPLVEVLGSPDKGFFDHAFELSVGYDLAGIQSEKMKRFLDGMLSAAGTIDRLREEIPSPFAELRDVPVPSRLVGMTNLSTFHGCPPEEIEGIVRHLMTAHDLDVTVKLNPTLLGPEAVGEILHDRLGYRDVSLVPEAFAEDLKFDRALRMIESLTEFAQDHGRRFGVKLTNTLVVENHRGILPGARMYLSGAPLHIMAVQLLDRLVEALPGTFAIGPGDGPESGPKCGPVPVAFSAGIDRDNLVPAVALGLEPVTICSDLLRPGGYGRMAQGLRKLVRFMKEEGLSNLAAVRNRAHEEALAVGHRDAIQAYSRDLGTKEGALRYTKDVVEKQLRPVDHQLEMFDCVACGNCVTVCPNNAFLAVPTKGVGNLAARDQYLVLAESCNDCGNCTTFCPEEGAPQQVKPRLFTKKSVWEAAGGHGFLLLAGEEGRLEIRSGERENEEARGWLDEWLNEGLNEWLSEGLNEEP